MLKCSSILCVALKQICLAEKPHNMWVVSRYYKTMGDLLIKFRPSILLYSDASNDMIRDGCPLFIKFPELLVATTSLLGRTLY